MDRFEFTYKDEYGRTLSHKFTEEMGIYTLVDVIASFSLFLKGVGFSDKDIDEFIINV